MSLRCHRFLMAEDGTLCRLANAKLGRMLRDPANHRLPVFAGQRVRMADVAVEVVDRVPVSVVRSTALSGCWPSASGRSPQFSLNPAARKMGGGAAGYFKNSFCG